MRESSEHKFMRLVRAHLDSLGATPLVDSSYDRVLATQYGPLHLFVDGCTVFGRFQEVKRAVEGISRIFGRDEINPYSGKWNHNYASWLTAQSAFDRFRYVLSCILADEVSPGIYQGSELTRSILLHAKYRRGFS